MERPRGMEEVRGPLRVYLREEREEDLELTMAWRSHPDVYQGFYSQNGPLRWREHWAWWHGRSKTYGDRLDWIIMVEDGETRPRAVGRISVNLTPRPWALPEEHADVGVLLGEVTLWGRGVAGQALEMVCAWLRQRGYARVAADIALSNKRTVAFFERHGFRYARETRPNEGRWLRDLTVSEHP